MVTCANCGARNNPNDAFCGNCGAFLEWAGQTPKQPPQPGQPAAPATPPAPAGGAGGDRGKYLPPTVVFEQSTLAVDPGNEVVSRVEAANRSGIVDQYHADVSGLPPEWIEVDPASLSLFPDDRGEFTIRFKPPRSSATTAGSRPFRVAVVSGADPAVRATVDGVLEIGGYHQYKAELNPHTSRARLTGRHRVSVTNEGNADARVVLSGKDPNNALKFGFKSDVVAVAPAATAETGVLVKPRRWRWLGPSQAHDFSVTAQPDGGEPLTLDGIMEQNAILPRWTMRAVLGLVILAVGAILLRSTVFNKEERASSSKDTTTVAPVTTVPVTTAPVTTVPGGGTTSTTTAATLPAKVYFVSTRQDGEQIWTMNADGANQVKITSSPGANTQPSVSPNRLSVVFVSTRDGNDEIYAMDASGSQERRLTNAAAAKDNFPRWSPDGQRIVFSSNRAPGDTAQADLWVMDTNGGNLVNITQSSNVLDVKPTWSSDGQSIAWERTVPNQPPQVWMMTINAANQVSNVHMVVGNGGRHPAFSPRDPTKLAYSDGTNVFTATVSTSGPATQPVALTANANVNVDPWWSPDASHLVFVSLRDGNEEIYIMAANGTDQQRLTNSTGVPPALSLDRFASM